MHSSNPMRSSLALAALVMLWASPGAQAQSDPWVGRWGAPRCGADQTEIALSRTTLDLSTFEAVCRVRTVRQRGQSFDIEASCRGEGKDQRVTFSVQVAGSVLTFIAIRGFDFDPKRFQRCGAPARETRASVTEGTAPQRVAEPGLPLRRGYYVADDTPCSLASNGTLSLLRRNAMGAGRELCQFKSVERLNESRYRVRESCQENGEQTVLYEILGQDRYRTTSPTGFAYTARYCAQSQLPLPWKTNPIDDLIR